MTDEFTPQELAVAKEMGYSKKDLQKLIEDRKNWHIPKVESDDEALYSTFYDRAQFNGETASELDFEK